MWLSKWFDQFRCKCTDKTTSVTHYHNDPYLALDTARMVKDQMEDLEYLKRVCGVADGDSTVEILAKTSDVIRRLRGEGG